jgi:hypothetical protein
MDVGLTEVLNALGQGERHREFAVVVQYHDEERQLPALVPYGDAAPLAPVDLGRLAGSKGQGQEGLARARVDASEVVLMSLMPPT